MRCLQIAHALSAICDQLERIAVFEVLREDEDTDAGLSRPDLLSGAQAIVSVFRGHANIGDDDIGLVGTGLAEQIWGIT